MNRSRWTERRMTYRIPLREAFAHCETDQTTGLYSLRDLSRGGAALEGSPPLQAGQRVGLRLLIPGHAPMAIKGSIQRLSVSPGRQNRLAVRFRDIGAEQEDRIANLIYQDVASGRTVTCLVASGSATERSDLSARLVAIGCSVVMASTPIEAIHCLEFRRHPIGAVVLGENVGDCAGVELASFMAAAYPSIRRVLASRPAGRREALAHRVAHATLDAPCTDRQLREAMGIKAA